tara:strand:+ start:98 stop:451 length:354 start_codon:yes stop_codon:yes gene_type:complete
MKPWQQAKKWLLEKHGEEDFEVLLGHCMVDGLVWSSSTEFLLAKKVRVQDGIIIQARNVDHNAWFVPLAAGTKPFSKFLELAPAPMEYVCWQRHGGKRFHIWRWDKFKGKVKNDGIK